MSFRVIAGTGEGRLGFVSLVLGDFAFLLRLGFSVVRREPTLVRFESEHVFVNVYHGRSSYAVGVDLGRLLQGDLYTLYEVLSAVSPSDVDRARYQASDSEELKRCLSRIAETLKLKCRTLLDGDDAAFEELQSVVMPMRQAATKQAQFGAILGKADRAWEGKEWPAALTLYEQAEPALSETQQRRLKFLRKKRK